MTAVIFLLPVSSQPRYHKRIRGLQQAGLHARALFFERQYFAGSALPCAARAIGRVRRGGYLSRLVQMCRAFASIRRETRNADIIYAFGLDMALLGMLAAAGRGQSLVYEMGDVRRVQLANDLSGRIVRLVERCVLRIAREVVVTAPGFATGYFSRYLGFDPRRVRVLENRVDLPASRRPNPPIHKDDTPIVIGYFGLLRCARSWQALQHLTKKANGAVRVIVRGYAFGVEVEREANLNPYIQYQGEYVAPDDLHFMYISVDLVWGCYPAPEQAEAGNWQWARTNRFYESCYFRRPLVTLAGTDEAREVESRGIGLAVDLTDPTQAAQRLLAALPTALSHWQRNVAAIPDEVCTYTDEHERFASSLRNP